MYKKIVHWYLSKEATPYWCVLAADSVVVYGSGLLACAAVLGPAETVQNLVPLCWKLGVSLLCFMVGFRLFHTYSGTVRKSSSGSLLRLFLSLLAGVALASLLHVLFGNVLFHVLGWRILLFQALFAIVLMCGLRVMARYFYDFCLRMQRPGGVYGLNTDTLLDMEMQDLLPREPIRVDMEAIRGKMAGRRIMVTGAAGSIGNELVRLLADCRPSELVLIDQAETPLHDVRMEMKRRWPEIPCVTIVTSVCHSHRMERIFQNHRPEIVFHAAAYKHVPMMEDNPVECILNNVDGTRKLADLAVRYGTDKFVMISTDKAVNPASLMGCSKRICERYCQSLSLREEKKAEGCHFITTRFGNVLGSNGSVIPIFREQIRRGGPVEVTHPDVIRYFMLIPEACRLVLEAAAIGHGGEIFVFDMGRPVRIADLARRMIALSGRPDIRIEYVGLRPGEKLSEELLAEEETLLPTCHGKIKIARVREDDFEAIKQEIERLVDVARTYDEAAVKEQMRRIVPEYSPVSEEENHAADM